MQGAAHFVALRLQRLRQPSHAPAGPPQRRFRIPAGRWFDQRLEIREQGRVLANRRLAARPRPPNPLGRLILRQFPQTAPDRAWRHAGRHRHRGNATISHGKRLRRRDQTTASFIKKRCHRQKPLSNGLDIDHNHQIWYKKVVVNSMVHSIRNRFDNFRSGPKSAVHQGVLVPILRMCGRRYGCALRRWRQIK